MKLLVIIVQDDDVHKLMKAFSKEDIRVTKLSSSGGFLRRGNTTLFVGATEDEVPKIKDILSKVCKSRTEVMPSIPVIAQGMVSSSEPIEVRVGGAVVFILDVEEFVKL